tara:strand:- start:251 stop:772 length:522 start_codon:yes stop_codon:yes gene_type:complete
MAIILPGGFNITNNEPSDSRFSVANASARYGLSAANIYEGLTVYEQDTDRYYVLFDTSNVGNASGWKEISTGNSFSGSSVIGSDLLNFHSITGSVNITGSLAVNNSNVEITGSLGLNFEGVGKYFAISVNGEEKVKVNNEGVFQLFSQSIAPTAVEGGIYFGNDYNLYLGVNQ